MIKKYHIHFCSAILSVILVFPAYALTVDNLALKSYIGQPFMAEMTVHADEGEKISNKCFSLSDTIDSNIPSLAHARFAVHMTDKKQGSLTISSSDVIASPLLRMSLHINCLKSSDHTEIFDMLIDPVPDSEPVITGNTTELNGHVQTMQSDATDVVAQPRMRHVRSKSVAPQTKVVQPGTKDLVAEKQDQSVPVAVSADKLKQLQSMSDNVDRISAEVAKLTELLAQKVQQQDALKIEQNTKAPNIGSTESAPQAKTDTSKQNETHSLTQKPVVRQLKKMPVAKAPVVHKEPVSWVWPSVVLLGLVSSLAVSGWWLRRKLPETNTFDEENEAANTLAGLNLDEDDGDATLGTEPVKSFHSMNPDVGIIVTESNGLPDKEDPVNLSTSLSVDGLAFDELDEHAVSHLPDFAADMPTNYTDAFASAPTDDAQHADLPSKADDFELAISADLPVADTVLTDVADSLRSQEPVVEQEKELVFSLDEIKPIEAYFKENEPNLNLVQKIDLSAPSLDSSGHESKDALLDFDFDFSSHNAASDEVAKSTENGFNLDLNHDDGHSIEFSLDHIESDKK
jgi:hypothetical protein